MIPLPPKVKLVIALFLVGGVGALTALGKVEPTWTWVATVVQLFVTGEVFFTVPEASAERIRAKAVRAVTTTANIAASALFVLFLSSCTPAQVAQAQTDTGQAIDLTNAICSLAPDSPVGQPFVSVICALAEGGEQLVNVVIGNVSSLQEAGVLPASASVSALVRVPVKQIEITIATTTAAKFLEAHKAKTK